MRTDLLLVSALLTFVPLAATQAADDAIASDIPHDNGDSETEVATSVPDIGSVVEPSEKTSGGDPSIDTIQSLEEPSTSTATTTPHSTPDSEATTTPHSTPDSEATTTPHSTPDSEATTTPHSTPDSEATTTPHSTPDSEATTTPHSTPDSEATTTPHSTPDSEATTPESPSSHKSTTTSSPTSSPHPSTTPSHTSTGGSTKPAPSSTGKHTVVDIVTVVVDGETLTSMETSVVNDDSSSGDSTRGNTSANVPYTSTFIEDGSVVVVTGVMPDPNPDTSKASFALKYNSDQVAVASVFGMAVAMALGMLV
ncbi:hypothetical protein H4S08_002318 [Coemansia sp. RSA 1365]|nr:hypothetical protein H4S08_002318 [Coemansia sp. RSA 1365]